MDLLRLATAGSVDDGKSTLIGRLLYESDGIHDDQLESLERTSAQRGHESVDLALLTDGLRAEREQGITIDVAYRSFVTPERRFVIADVPGHLQYTRNMVTGASTADVGVIVVDVRKGLIEQSRRHASIAALLRVSHLVLAVNKMDLVGWDEDAFGSLSAEFMGLCGRLGVKSAACIPMSALLGDNVVEPSPNMAWYRGPTLLHHLEQVPVAGDDAMGLRFPVQWVVRPAATTRHDYRGYAGQVAAGSVRPDDEVVVLPSAQRVRVSAVETAAGPMPEAGMGQAVTVRLDGEYDVSRGNMLCAAQDLPRVEQDLEAVVCWLGDRPLAVGGRFALKHTTQWTRAVVSDVSSRLDVSTLEEDAEASELVLNDIGLVRLRTMQPLFYDPYARARVTGSFILVNTTTNATVGAGMLIEPGTRWPWS